MKVVYMIAITVIVWGSTVLLFPLIFPMIVYDAFGITKMYWFTINYWERLIIKKNYKKNVSTTRE